MSAAVQPLVSLEASGQASIINYQLPEPTSYLVQQVVDIQGVSGDCFKPALRSKPAPTSAPITAAPVKPGVEASPMVLNHVSAVLSGTPGLASPLSRQFVGVTPARLATLGRLGADGNAAATASSVSRTRTLGTPTLNPAAIAAAVQSGAVYAVSESFSGLVREDLYTLPANLAPTLSLIFRLKMNNFLGDYGAGRVVSTFSLLPGESTSITVKTYKSSTSTAEASSSIVESYSSTAAQELEEILHEGQSNSCEINSTKAHGWNLGGAIKGIIDGASMGIPASGEVGVSGGYESSNQEGETFSSATEKITDATERQSMSASSQRDVTVNTTTSTTTTSGSDQTITRTLQNANLSRTLNFVFRQMNQEFLTLLCLEDVEVGYFGPDGRGSWSTERCRLYSLDGFLEKYLVPERVADVKKRLMHILRNIKDCHGALAPGFIDNVTTQTYDGKQLSYSRVNGRYSQDFKSTSGHTVTVKGIVVSAKANVIRTDGIMVEALLGQGEALDTYNQGLQTAKVQEKNLANLASQLDNEVQSAGLGIAKSGSLAQAEVFQAVFGESASVSPPPPSDAPAP